MSRRRPLSLRMKEEEELLDSRFLQALRARKIDNNLDEQKNAFILHSPIAYTAGLLL